MAHAGPLIRPSRSVRTAICTGGALFPYLNQNLDAYPNAIERSLAEALVNAKVFRFDASDLMPASVGAGSFWEGIVDWVSGKSLDATLADIQKSWPK